MRLEGKPRRPCSAAIGDGWVRAGGMFIKVKIGPHIPNIRAGRILTGATLSGPSHRRSTVSFSPFCERRTGIRGDQTGATVEAQ